MEESTQDAGQRLEPMSPEELREKTAQDCEQIANMITNVAASVRRGSLLEFEAFFWQGGTSEGDSKIVALRQALILRYSLRQERVQATAVANAGKKREDQLL